MNITFDLIIFDLDGTLVDSLDGITASVALALRQENIPADPARIKALIGLPLVNILDGIAGPDTPPALMARLVKAYLDDYHAHCVERSAVYPGIRELVQRLGPRRTAVATTKRTPGAALLLAGLGLAPHLGLIQGTDGFPAKPDPAVLFRVLDHFRLPPERALFVGDTPIDIEAGRRAGIRTCGVTWGNSAREALTAAGATWIADRTADIPGV